MPYTDPDDANRDVVVRFPGDPFPHPVEHNRFDRRESTVAEILGERGLYPPSPASDAEVLMAAPGSSPIALAEIEGYGAVVDDAYASALPKLTTAQREAWDLERDGLTQRQAETKLGLVTGAVSHRLKRARQRLSAQMDWVIAPELKAKFRKPKPPAKPRPIAWTLTMQRIGADLAYIESDEAARWRVARQLDHALSLGMSPTDLCRRTGLLPTALAELVSDFRNG